MILQQILIDDAHLERFLDCKTSPALTDKIQALIKHQKRSWPELSKALDHLQKALTRKMHLTCLDVILQCNPGRIHSTKSPIDKKSISQRPCFLCPPNLYPEQKALLYQKEWLVLNNPAPLFCNHLVISHTNHAPQRIAKALNAMFSLVRDLEGTYTAFFNGPSCGASAPDHLHFQLCPSGEIPLMAQIQKLKDTSTCPFTAIEEHDEGSCFTGFPDNRSMFVCRSKEGNFFIDRLRRVLHFLHGKYEDLDEPSVNVVIGIEAGVYQGIIFPRKAHRPTCYGNDGSDGILVSPGAVDVGGLVILPRREDFEIMDTKKVLEIFADVCHGPEIFEHFAL